MCLTKTSVCTNNVYYKFHTVNSIKVQDQLFCSVSTVAVALGSLTLWHAVLISRGETSIERHINSKERNRVVKRGGVSMSDISRV